MSQSGGPSIGKPTSAGTGIVARQATASAEASFRLYAKASVQPAILYHYTSPEGLIGITKSNQIFATNIRYLNDASEYIYAQELFIGRQEQFGADSDDENVSLYLRYLQKSPSDLHERQGDYYVVSFSANGDVLSQWQGYCPLDGGYSLGFSATSLREAAKQEVSLFKAPWRLVQCEYEGEEQFKLVDDVISQSIEAFQHYNAENEISKFLQGEVSGEPSILIGLRADFDHAIETLAPVLKHSAYAHEREWRLVSPRIIDGDPCIEFRPGRFSLFPHVLFELPPIEECVVGPCVNQALSRRAAEQVCNVPIARTSRIPFRTL